MKRGTPKAPKVQMAGPNTVHVALSDELHGKLGRMSLQDQRKPSDFIRVLLEAEWRRRNTEAAAVGVSA